MNRVDCPVSKIFERVGLRISPHRIGIHLQAIFKALASRIWLALIIQKTTKNQPIDDARGPGNEKAIGRCRRLMTRPKNQILTSLALVGTRASHIHHKAEERIIDCSWTCTRWNLHNDRTIAEIEKS